MVERIVPRQIGAWENLEVYLMYLRHLAAYRYAESFARGLKVLDLGCGVGYGSKRIAETATQVVGIDMALNVLQNNRFGSPPVVFINGKCEQLPLPDQSFNLIISLQVIEHIWSETSYLEEVNRVLGPGGYFIVSTPNRVLRLLPYQPPINPYHVREYDRRSLERLLRQYFSTVDIRGLQAIPEIMAMERKRLKQNPVKVYGELIAKKILPHSAVNHMRRLVKSLRQYYSYSTSSTASNQPNVPPFALENGYATSDFWVDSNHVDTSLDLIGICRK